MTELETALRTMLHERAGDIAVLPPHLAELRRPEPSRLPARRTVLLIAATVAAVLAVVGSVVAVRSGAEHHSVPPATHTPPPSHVNTTPAPVAKVRATCAATLPSGWTNALAERGSTLGAASVMPLAASASGAVLVARDFGQRRDVVLLKPGAAPRSIFTVPHPDQNTVEHGTLEGRWALIPVEYRPRTSVSIVPSVVEVDLVDIDTGKVRTLDRAPIVIAKDGEQGRTIDGATMQAGLVYWDARAKYGSDNGVVRQYDVNNRTTRTIFTGVVNAPEATAAGVSWTGYPSLTVQIPAHLPAQVPPSPAGSLLSSDGTSYAWVAGDQLVGWWSPGTATPRYFRFPAVHKPTPETVQDLLVAGPIVSVDDYLLDTRTGAIARLPSKFRLGGSRMTTFLYAGGDVLVGYQLPGSNKQAATLLIQLDTRTLPALRC